MHTATHPRSDYYEIDPATSRWPLRRRLGFGLLAWLPTLLLGAAMTLGVAHVVTRASEAITEAAAILLYTHFVAQALVVMVFGHLLLNHEHVPAAAKAFWSVAFLLAAPVAIPSFWIVHVLAEDAQSEPSARRVRVLDTVYRGEVAQARALREDGVEVIRRPAPRRSEPAEPWSTTRGGEPCST